MRSSGAFHVERQEAACESVGRDRIDRRGGEWSSNHRVPSVRPLVLGIGGDLRLQASKAPGLHRRLEVRPVTTASAAAGPDPGRHSGSLDREAVIGGRGGSEDEAAIGG